MQTITLGVSPLRSSRLAYGCWRVAGSWDPREITPESWAAGKLAIRTAYEAGYTLFDNADIYCGGEAERLLGEVLREIPGMRERVLIATKCGIRPPNTPYPGAPQRYDFSAEHILRSCEESLRRLGIDTLDLLLLHRPDFLANPEEVADAFARLQAAGKVRFFGVSNCRPTLLTALQCACPMPLIVHQVEISLLQREAFTDGTLDQCLIEHITPQAWSPLAGGLLADGASRLLRWQERYSTAGVLQELDALARQYQTTRSVIALAWLLKHPSGIVPIVGSTRPERIREAVRATEIELSRDDWYRLLLAARGEPLP
ncbi:aldo/keto reductase [Limisphaera sp. VF-2]|jgi:predicted oxidoreductase|uniref:aldo/keto reductase n=1 Tax=Limisphaera sp. VF-2 TaxID=3400418 RepID=UPI001772C96E|nr:aldo/keto reductase [Limisphaera sp.]